MKKGLIALLVIAAIVVAAILFFTGRYNKMVELNQQTQNAWAQVETSYQRRNDLIPNFVNTVKGYAQHEQSTFTAVVEARSKATQATVNFDDITDESLARFQQSQGEISQALGRLMAISESYPDLKANQNFAALQDELAGTENRIAVARRDFNDTATIYNTYIKRFPSNVIAGMFGFSSKALFAAEVGSDQAPKVEF